MDTENLFKRFQKSCAIEFIRRIKTIELKINQHLLPLKDRNLKNHKDRNALQTLKGETISSKKREQENLSLIS